MIIGKHSLDPRRILNANYSIASDSWYNFKIGYVVGNSVIEISQFGTKKQCKEWLSLADSVIGKGPLIDAVSNRELEDDDDLEELGKEKKIGFA